MEKEVKNEAPAMTPEQAADLAALQAGAAVEVEAGAPEAAEPQANLADEIKGLTLAFVAMASPILPSLGRIYTEETTASAAAAVAAVCEKHGWASGGIMGEWGVEISAAVVILPLAFATVQGVKEDIAANNAKAKQISAPAYPEKPVPGPVAGFGPVQPLVGVPGAD